MYSKLAIIGYLISDYPRYQNINHVHQLGRRDSAACMVYSFIQNKRIGNRVPIIFGTIYDSYMKKSLHYDIAYSGAEVGATELEKNY